MCVSACESLGDTAADSVIVRCNPMVQYITGSSAVQFFYSNSTCSECGDTYCE